MALAEGWNRLISPDSNVAILKLTKVGAVLFPFGTLGAAVPALGVWIARLGGNVGLCKASNCCLFVVCLYLLFDLVICPYLIYWTPLSFDLLCQCWV